MGISSFRTDLVLGVLQLAHFLGVAEFLLIDGVELRAKQLGLRLQRDHRQLQLLHLMETENCEQILRFATLILVVSCCHSLSGDLVISVVGVSQQFGFVLLQPLQLQSHTAELRLQRRQTSQLRNDTTFNKC